MNIIKESRGILDTGKIENMVKRVQEMINTYPSNLLEITLAANLAYHGVLESVERLVLSNVDLTSVPAEHLASLVSIVMGRVTIDIVSGCGLVNILDSVESEMLAISRQSLDIEETQALVQAMESGVEKMLLYEGVTLDIRVLTEYSGQGKCRAVDCYCGDTVARYREHLKTWAVSRNWPVIHDSSYVVRLGIDMY